MTIVPPDTLIPGLDVPVMAIRDIIRDVARDEILSRYLKLSGAQISEKRPGEVVTEADVAAEIALANAIRAKVNNCLIVGEEGIEDTPDLMERLDNDVPVFILDPVDGTQNFANGQNRFAVIVAYRRNGETLAGWIHDPLSSVTCWAARNTGAYFDNGSAVIRHKGRDIESLKGCFGLRAQTAMREKPDRKQPTLVPRYRCVGREYFDLVERSRTSTNIASYVGLNNVWRSVMGESFERPTPDQLEAMAKLVDQALAQLPEAA